MKKSHVIQGPMFAVKLFAMVATTAGGEGRTPATRKPPIDLKSPQGAGISFLAALKDQRLASRLPDDHPEYEESVFAVKVNGGSSISPSRFGAI